MRDGRLWAANFKLRHYPNSLTIVFLLAPVMREMARIETPSTIMPRIWARASRESLFILR